MGNFYKADKKLTYTASKVHYNYWLAVNIPVIMVAYLPESGKTYWQEISSNKFRKARRKWKLDIPLKQVLNSKSENKLSELLEY